MIDRAVQHLTHSEIAREMIEFLTIWAPFDGGDLDKTGSRRGTATR